MVKVENLVKKYGENVVLNGLNLTVDKGEILGFLGPNGAGKSTTMNIITGYTGTTGGTVKIDGIDILKQPKITKRKIGYLPEVPPLYMDMTIEEYLKFICKIKFIQSKKINEVLKQICDKVNISQYKNRLIRNLSKGYKQRVGLAQAIIGDPELLILDEPTVGLDPKEIIEIRNIIKQMGKKHTIILSSHILSEVSAVCDRVVIINKGEIVASGTPEELSKKVGYCNKILLRLKGKNEEISTLLKNINNVENVVVKGVVERNTVDLIVEAKQDEDIREALFWRLSKAEVPVLLMKPVDLSLEEVFLQVTTKGGGE